MISLTTEYSIISYANDGWTGMCFDVFQSTHETARQRRAKIEGTDQGIEITADACARGWSDKHYDTSYLIVHEFQYPSLPVDSCTGRLHNKVSLPFFDRLLMKSEKFHCRRMKTCPCRVDDVFEVLKKQSNSNWM